jgi:hypothetical protein
MVSLGNGYSTCREHGGTFAGYPAAYAHLERDHPQLVELLKGARAIPVPEGADPDRIADVIAHEQPNRAARRRAMRERCDP